MRLRPSTTFVRPLAGMLLLAGCAALPGDDDGEETYVSAASAVNAVTRNIPAEADAEVQQARPTTSFGSSVELGSDRDPARHAYLRFDLAGVTGPVLSAKLRCYVVNESVQGPEVFSTSSAWSESTLRWDNRPAPQGSALSARAAIGWGKWFEADVTAAVKAGQKASFVLVPTSTDSMICNSREAPSNRPELVVTTDAAIGTGLSATYFDNVDFTGTAVTRTDPTVSFDWGSGSPAPGIAADTFSARWTGQVDAPAAGSYTFYTQSDDGVRLFIDGTKVIDAFTDHGSREDRGTISLTAGRHDVKLEYYERTGSAVLALSWSSASIAKQIIPTSRLFPGPLAPPPPPPPPVDPADLPGWGLPILRDEFDYRDASGKPAINPAIWNVRPRSELGLLNDATVVDPGQITVDQNGIAHIRADWLDEPVIASTGPAQRWMKTGYMDMRALRAGDVTYAQRYGRWEIRAKVPTMAGISQGTLPAFWLRNSNSGEIDIMEAWGSGPNPFSYQRIGTSTTTVHTQTSGTGNVKNAWTLEPLVGATEHVAARFHTWALEFTPSRFAVYYDGKLAVETTPAQKPEIWGPSFQTPLHVRINLHVGPSELYYGLPDPNHKDWTSDTDFQIDYVRIWAMKQ